MGHTWFQRRVVAVMGYLRDPKAGNSGHAWLCWLKLYRASQRDWQEMRDQKERKLHMKWLKNNYYHLDPQISSIIFLYNSPHYLHYLR